MLKFSRNKIYKKWTSCRLEYLLLVYMWDKSIINVGWVAAEHWFIKHFINIDVVFIEIIIVRCTNPNTKNTSDCNDVFV